MHIVDVWWKSKLARVVDGSPMWHNRCANSVLIPFHLWYLWSMTTEYVLIYIIVGLVVAIDSIVLRYSSRNSGYLYLAQQSKIRCDMFIIRVFSIPGLTREMSCRAFYADVVRCRRVVLHNILLFYDVWNCFAITPWMLKTSHNEVLYLILN